MFNTVQELATAPATAETLERIREQINAPICSIGGLGWEQSQQILADAAAAIEAQLPAAKAEDDRQIVAVHDTRGNLRVSSQWDDRTGEVFFFEWDATGEAWAPMGSKGTPTFEMPEAGVYDWRGQRIYAAEWQFRADLRNGNPKAVALFKAPHWIK